MTDYQEPTVDIPRITSADRASQLTRDRFEEMNPRPEEPDLRPSPDELVKTETPKVIRVTMGHLFGEAVDREYTYYNRHTPKPRARISLVQGKEAASFEVTPENFTLLINELRRVEQELLGMIELSQKIDQREADFEDSQKAWDDAREAAARRAARKWAEVHNKPVPDWALESRDGDGAEVPF